MTSKESDMRESVRSSAPALQLGEDADLKSSVRGTTPAVVDSERSALTEAHSDAVLSGLDPATEEGATRPSRKRPTTGVVSLRTEREVEAARLEEAKVVEAVRSGDQSASTEFFALVSRAVRGTLYQVLGPGDRDHDDLFQLSLEKIVTSVMRGQFSGRCSLATWASVITSRVAIDALRRRRNERRIFSFKKEEEDDWEMPSPEASRPDRLASDRSELQAIRRALGKISPDKAETVVLFEVMGHDLSEIAEMTGVSVAAAQSRLVRGRKELARKLKAELGTQDVS